MSIKNGLFPESLQEIVKRFKPQTPFELTVGCELEFILVYRKKPTEEDLTYKQGVNIIRAAFQEPLEVVCQSCRRNDQFILPLNEYDTNDRDKWEIELEGLYPNEEIFALGVHRENYGCKGIEVKSRILGAEACHQKKCCGKGVTIEEEITAVLERLRSYFRRLDGKGPTAKHYIYVNSSCGFHVHVRVNEPEKSDLWPLASLQKLLSLQVACERQLDSMHAVGRINGFIFDEEIGLRKQPFPRHPAIESKIYNQPLSMFLIANADRKRRRDREQRGDDLVRTGYEIDESQASKNAKEDPNEHLSIWLARRLPDIDSWITQIQSTQELQDVVNLIKGTNGKFCVFNTENIKLNNKAKPKKDTVEFRQCRGTLSVDEVIHHISFVMHMVVYCHLIREKEFYSLIGSQGALLESQFSIFSLLERIKCSNATRKHYGNLLDDKKGVWPESLEDDYKYLESIISHEPLAALACAVIKQEIKSVNPQLAEKRIRFKLTYGGYGRFSKEWLESAPLINLSYKDRASVIERLRLDKVARINDDSAPATDAPGVNASGYGEVHSDDSDPQLNVEESELPRRIKRILIEKKHGKYKPRLPDGSQAFQRTNKSRASTPSTPSLSDLPDLSKLLAFKPKSLQRTESEASLPDGEDRALLKPKALIGREESGRQSEGSSLDQSERDSRDRSRGDSRGSSGRERRGRIGGDRGGDTVRRSLLKTRGSGSLSGSVDSSRRSGSNSSRKGRDAA